MGHHQARITATYIDDGLADGLGDVVSQEYSSKELCDSRQDDCLLQGHGLGPDRGCERVSYIVRTDPERSEKCPEGADDNDPKEVIGRLWDEKTLLRVTHGGSQE